MDNKEFAKQLEKRTKKLAVSVVRLSVLLPSTPEGKIIRNQFKKLEPVLVPIIGKRIVQGVKQISLIK
jgi:hypothetical protein